MQLYSPLSSNSLVYSYLNITVHRQISVIAVHTSGRLFVTFWLVCRWI